MGQRELTTVRGPRSYTAFGLRDGLTSQTSVPLKALGSGPGALSHQVTFPRG